MRLKWLRDKSFNVTIAVYAAKFAVRHYESLSSSHLLEKTLIQDDL